MKSLSIAAEKEIFNALCSHFAKSK